MRVHAGRIAFARTPAGPKSTAIVWISITIAAFEAEYAALRGPTRRADAEAIATMLPRRSISDGSAARDYTFVSDTIDGVIAATKKEFGYEIFNLGESETISLSRMIGLLETALGKKAIIDRQPLQAGDVPITFANISKAREKLGYNPQIKFENGVKLFAEWFRKSEGK